MCYSGIQHRNDVTPLLISYNSDDVLCATVPVGSSPHTSERGAYITTVVMEDGGKPRDSARHYRLRIRPRAPASAALPFVTPLTTVRILL